MVDGVKNGDLDLLDWWIEQCDWVNSGQLSILEYCAVINTQAIFGSVGKTVPAYYAIISQLAHDAYEYTPEMDSRDESMEYDRKMRNRISFASDAMKVLRGYIQSERAEINR